MTIRYVQTNDNKYVQYRLMYDTFNTTPANWQGVDAEPTAGSKNLVESRGVDNAIQLRKEVIIKGFIINSTLYKFDENYTFDNNDVVYSISSKTLRLLKVVYYREQSHDYYYETEQLIPNSNVIYHIGNIRLKNYGSGFSLLDKIFEVYTIENTDITSDNVKAGELFFNVSKERSLKLKIISTASLSASISVSVSSDTVFIDKDRVVSIWDGVSDIRSAGVVEFNDKLSVNEINANWDFGFYDLSIPIGSAVGSAQTATQTKYIKIPVSQGDIYLIKVWGSSSRALPCGIVDSDNRLIYKVNRYGESVSTICAIPEDGAFMIVQNAVVYEPKPFIVKRNDVSKSNQELLFYINKNFQRLDNLTNGISLEVFNTENLTESQAISSFPKIASGTYGILLDATNSIGKSYSAVTKADLSLQKSGYVLKIPVVGVKNIEYPAFATTSGYGCLMTDSNDIVIGQYINNTGSLIQNKIILPQNSAYFYFSTGSGLKDTNYTISIYSSSIDVLKDYVDSNVGINAVIRWLPYYMFSNLSSTVCNSLNLAAIRFKYENNKMPFQNGYLFHYVNDDSMKVFYGNTLDNPIEYATLDYKPSQCVVGMSPKDGTIVSAFRNIRAALRVYHDGQNYTVDAKSSDGENASPKGWLYNCGCEFIADGSNEYCIFAEYDGNYTDNQRLYIWKGTYPYTSAANWKTVYYKTTSYNNGNPTPSSITHWHMIRRDPWSDIIYCTSGDLSGQFFWLYSEDNSETWNELASDSNVSTTPDWVLDGQPLRCLNFIFTEDYIYFATDHGSNNTLSRIRRDNNGLIDLTTREIMANIPYGVAVNGLCYVESPNGLLMFTRIDTGFTNQYSNPVPVLFWSFKYKRLIEVASLKKTSATWGGHRGKCYSNYTNGQEPRPAMGFAANTPCMFDLNGGSERIGTIYYEL